jgi:tetratricopeptide (TPR) repeat protein
VSVGPGTADTKGRVRVEVPVTGENLNRDPATVVSQTGLSVPDKARRAYADAERKLQRRDVIGATKDLERAVEVAPKFAAAWNHLGTIAYQTRNYNEAERCFRTALDADPGMYEPLVNLGGVLITLGNYDEAWKVNVEAVVVRPGDALAHSQLGMTYLFLNKLDLAEKHLLEAVSLDPGHFSHPQIHLAEIYVRRKDLMRAAEQAEDFIRRHPDDPSVPTLRETLGKWRQGR